MRWTGQTREARVPAISKPLLAFFRHIVRGQFRRRFHVVRLAGADRVRELDGPLIVFANHIGWWDPMIAFLVASKLLPERRHYAPMDAASLARYRILSWLGVFPIEMNTARGAVQFLRTGAAILRAGGVLWITPQGRFADARERPLEFKAGLTALAARVPGCRLLPMAIEYTFWEEKTPEALLLLCEPVRADAFAPERLEAELVSRLERGMDELRGLAMARRAEGFDRVLLAGRAGVGGFYAFGQQLRSWVAGRSYRSEHASAAVEASGLSPTRKTGKRSASESRRQA